METKYMDLKNSLTGCNDIEKSVNTTNILKRAIWIVAGIILLIAGMQMNTRMVSLALTLLSLGGTLVLIGIWMLCTRTRRWVYRPTGSPLHLGQLMLPRDQMNTIHKAIQEGDFSVLNKNKENTAGGVKVEYAVTSDGSFGMIQMALYEGYTFVPTSEVIELKGSKAQELADLFVH